MFDYEEAKLFFSNKLASDLEGHGRFESAMFHTVKMIYEKGLRDGGEHWKTKYFELVAMTSDIPKND